MSFEDVGGRQTNFGVLPKEEKFGKELASAGKFKEVSWVFDFDDLPADDAGNEMLSALPTGAFIKTAQLEVLTAMTGTSGTLTLGLEQADGGGAIDADGIDAAIAQAALVANAIINCDGALVGGSKITERGVLIATTGGTVTAGRFKLTIEYGE